MTVTPAKLAANRANAQKSTGPRTREGKARSSRNATTHGIFCSDLVLPHEGAKLFKAFRDAFLLDLQPGSIVELMLVDRIVSASWKLKRLNRIEAIITDDYARLAKETQEDALADIDPERRFEIKQSSITAAEAQAIAFCDNESPALERLSRHAQRLELSIHRALRELQNLRKGTQSKRKHREAEEVFLPQLPIEEEGETDDDVEGKEANGESICARLHSSMEEGTGETSARSSGSQKVGRFDPHPGPLPARERERAVTPGSDTSRIPC